MTRVDPFLIPLPSKLQQDAELRPYFEYLNKFLHDMFLRTGGGKDSIEVNQATVLITVTAVNLLIAAVNELVDDHEVSRLAAETSKTLTDELRDDHGAFVTLTSELKTDVDDLKTSLTALLTKMDTDFADVANASTDYVASITVPAPVAAADVASITAPASSAPPDALTNNDDIDPI